MSVENNSMTFKEGEKVQCVLGTKKISGVVLCDNGTSVKIKISGGAEVKRHKFKHFVEKINGNKKASLL